MFYSFVMGVDDSIDQLRSEGFLIEQEGENYRVSFPADHAWRWKEFISGRLKEGYWNEYLAGERVIFIFHLPDGIKRYEVVGFENEEVLRLCEKLCECQFDSIYSLLSSNHFYKGKI